MRTGQPLVINLEGLTVDFQNEFTNEYTFPSELVFDHDAWRQRDNYKQILKEEENYKGEEEYDLGFEIHPDFSITILCTYIDDDTCETQMGMIPHSQQMQKMYLEE